jgi:molybdopterin molybdotransferase
MIEVKQAQQIILESIKPLEEEVCELTLALGRTLNEDIYAKEDSPGFDCSAMDGYAVISADTIGASKENPVILEVIENLPAGYVPSKVITQGKASRIMTGAVIPKGADAVVMVEDTKRKIIKDEKKEVIMVFKEVKPGENIRKRGEDVKRGELVLKKSTVLTSAEIGMLASLGYAKVRTVRPAVVAILSTGDELVEPGEELTLGKIRNSNTYSLMAQVQEAGGIPLNLGIAKDEKETLRKKIEEALQADFIITSAGVSVGEYDLVKDILVDMGLRVLFWKVAIKPGKPTVFGLLQGKPYLGLPGYPVSSMVTFELFARPAILKMQGRKDIFRPKIKVVILEDMKKKTDREHYLRAIVKYNSELKRYEARLTGPQESGILSSMVKANALVILPKEVSFITKGTEVEAMLLRFI